MLPPDEIQDQLRFLEPAVHKTGDDEERQAFQMLLDFMRDAAREEVVSS